MTCLDLIERRLFAMKKKEIIVVAVCLTGLLLAECFISNQLTSRVVGGISAAVGLLYVFISESRSKN